MPKKRNVLITGASRGIGKAIALSLGADITYRLFCPTRHELDLGNPASVDAFLAKKPAIDILINNAGINLLRSAEEIDADSIRQMLDVNLVGPLKLASGLAAGMKRRRWGRIVNLSSIWGISSKERRALYSVTKFGINGLTKALAKELGPYNVLVNSVCPGYVDTELTRKNLSALERAHIKKNIPLRRFADPGEIAELVAFLVSGKNSYVTGQCLLIDGGFL